MSRVQRLAGARAASIGANHGRGYHVRQASMPTRRTQHRDPAAGAAMVARPPHTTRHRRGPGGLERPPLSLAGDLPRWHCGAWVDSGPRRPAPVIRERHGSAIVPPAGRRDRRRRSRWRVIRGCLHACVRHGEPGPGHRVWQHCLCGEHAACGMTPSTRRSANFLTRQDAAVRRGAPGSLRRSSAATARRTSRLRTILS